MRTFFTTYLALIFTAMVSAQSPANFWQEVTHNQIFLPENAETVTMPPEYRSFSLNFDAMRNYLRNAPPEGSAAAKAGTAQIVLPMPDGSMETFRVWESSVMAPELAAKFPMIKTYAGRGITDPTHTVRLGTGLNGFHAVIISENGGSIVAPYATNQTQYYINFRKSNFIWQGLDLPETFIKYVPMEGENRDGFVIENEPEIQLRGGGEGELVELRKYRFALACTGEYGSTHGNTIPSVMSTLVTAANTLNSVLERDADMQLVLIGNNENLVFIDPVNDPYNNANMGTALLGQNEAVLNNIVGLANFDVGHVFTGPCNDVGGVVSGSVCSGGKARGVTCHFNSNVIATTLSIAAHEMGHQFSGGHTFNNCPGSEGQFHSSSAFEPGSGSTILSYQGACGSNNIPGPSQIFYHGGTIGEFWQYTHLSGGNFCPIMTVTSNHSPAVELPYTDGFSIPISTPFELYATASDEDGDPLTYSWEQIDLGPNSQLGTPLGDAPSFRSFDPVTNPLRTFPRLSVLLNNGSENTEVLPAYSRNLTFRCTVRDNNTDEGAGGITWQDVAFKATASAGPFLVSSPNSVADTWKAGELVEVTWDVANTDSSAVNCHSVNIRLSVNGGNTYPYTLISSTPNDGSEMVFVPDVVTGSARVRVEAANNIFFDISNQNFEIEAATEPGFTLAVDPQWQQACVPEDAVLEVQTGSVLNFDTLVELEVVDGLPAGVTVTFSQNPVPPGESTTMTLDMASVVDDGLFTVQLRAIAGADTAYETLYFNVVYSDFTQLTLDTPADGEASLSLLPDFSWMDLPQADLYDFQLSTSPGFEEEFIIDEAFNLFDAFYVPDVALTESTIYYWRIRPSNECGKAGFTAAHTFQTYIIQCAPFNGNDVPLNISPVGLPTVESVMPIISSGVISDMNVSKLKGNHDALPYIEASLTSPQGTEVVLFSGICGNVSAFDMALDDEAPFEINCPPLNGLKFKPQNPLAAFIGENTLGDWTMKIKVIDTDGQGGTLNAWGLEFCASITPNNPFLVNNDTLLVPPNDTRIIHNIHLSVQDMDNAASELQFTIVHETAYGYVAREGVPLGIGDHFTMSDIYAYKMTYTNTDPDELYDDFTFIVEDGTGGWLGTPKYNIKMDPDAPVAVDEKDYANSLQLFPNPAANVLNVAFQQPLINEATIVVTDVHGRKVTSQVAPQSQDVFTVRLDGFADGVYILTVRTAEGVFARKFVVQK
jgi:reprolysin-like metallo-peptidase family M12B/cadherin-like protein/type IX secretion system substrate protein/proprotein convertase P-domain-containing protein